MADATADPWVGEVLEGRYRIIEPIGSGGMGVIYRAERLGLGRFVAVKFLRAAADEQSLQRFEREARAMSRLSHPHVVSVIDFGVASSPYIVMEYVTGRPLEDLIALGPVAAPRAIDIMRQVTAGLAHAHGQDIVHRDVKPGNVMLTEATGTGDFVRILDFGLAKLRGGANLSASHIVVGTPSYMAPEQARGEETDGRADIYASGVLLFELLTNRKPFVGEDTLETLRMHQHEPVPPLGEVTGAPDLSLALEGVIHRAMAKKPEDRYATALEMGTALEELADRHKRASARPRGKGKKVELGRADTVPSLSERMRKITAEAPEPEPELDGATPLPSSAPPAPRRSHGGLLFLLLLAVAGAAGYLWWQRQQRPATAQRRGMDLPAGGAVASAADAGAAPAPDAGFAGELLPLADAAAAVTDAAPPTDAAPAAATDAAAADQAALADAGEDEGEGEGDEGEDDEGEEEPDAGVATAATPPPRPASVERAADVKALIARHEISAAAAGLHKLLRRNPKSAYYHLLLAHLNWNRGWWSQALKGYRTACRLKHRYRRYKSINDHAIRALGSRKTRWLATSLITKTLRRAALPHLRRAARSNKSALIRRRAAALIKRIR